MRARTWSEWAWFAVAGFTACAGTGSCVTFSPTPATGVSVVGVGGAGAGTLETLPPFSEAELGPAAAKVWANDIAGKKDSPLVSRLVATLAGMGQRRQVGLGESAVGKLVSDGKLVALLSKHALLVADARTGEVRSANDTPAIDDVQAVKGSNLFVAHEGTMFSVREAPGGKAAFIVNDAAFSVTAEDGSVVVVATTRGLVVYEPRTKARREVAFREALPIVQVVLGDNNRVATVKTTGGDDITVDLSTGLEVVRQPAFSDLEAPAFSPDGRWMAHVAKAKNDERPKETKLFDRMGKKERATSAACPYPTSFAFSPDSKTLAVGDLVRACLLEVPSLRLIAKTGALRPAGVDDNLQNTTVSYVSDSLVVATMDRTVGIFSSPSAKKLWLGRAFVFRETGTTKLASDETHEILTVGPHDAIARRLTTPDEQERTETSTFLTPEDNAPEALLERVDAHVCRLGEWLLPRSACD